MNVPGEAPEGFFFIRMEGTREVLGLSYWQSRFSPSRLVYSRLGLAEACPPLDPLLPFLVTELGALPPQRREALVRRARFLEPHVATILRYVQTGELVREDEFAYAAAGLRFEQEALLDAVGRLLLLLARERTPNEGPLVLVWENFHHAGQALLAWTLRFLAQPLPPNLVFVTTFRGRVVSRDLEFDLWTPLLRRVEDRGWLHRWVFTEPFPAASEADPVPSDAELLAFARTSRGFLALEDSLRYYQELERRGTDPEDSRFPLEMGEVLLLLGRIDRASLPLTQALERARRRRQKGVLIRALVHLCHLEIGENNWAQARRYWRMAVEKSGPTRDETWYTLRLLKVVLHQSVLDDGWFGAEFEELKEHYRSRRWYHCLNYLESLVPYYRYRVQRSGWESAKVEALAVLHRVHLSRNHYWESVLFHCLGFIHEYAGRQAEALAWFRKGIQVRRRLGDPVELIKVYNGAGYFHFSTGDFAQAARYYRESLILLEQVRDFPEICLTLFNMTLIFFFSGSFSRALGFLQTILEIMDALGLEVLPWHRKAKLYALAGVSAFRTGQLSSALEFYDKARSEPYDSDAEASVSLLEVLVNAGTLTEDQILSRFDRSLGQVSAENQLSFRIHLLAERAQYLGPVRGRSSLDEARGLASSRGLSQQQALLDSLSQGGGFPVRGGRLPERVSALISGLRSSARQEASGRLLLAKVKEVSFLRHFQSQVTSEQDPDTLFRRVFELVRGQFLLQAGAVWRESASEQTLLHGFGTLRNRVDRQFLYRFQTEAETFRLVLEDDAEDRTLGPETQRTLTMAFQHLELVLELMEARQILKRAATRDRLTGLLSRQELLERIDGERRRALRYGHQKGRYLALLFLDLDNFKAYNDTFGHAAGDFALQCFAKMVQGHIRTLDVFGRYGGDEFLLMLPETDADGARVTAERILEAMTRADGFLESLSVHLGRPLSLPPGRRLGCSIGIAVQSQCPSADTAALVAQADAALYRTKAAGKGTYVIFRSDEPAPPTDPEA